MPHEFTSERLFTPGEIMWHCWLTSYKGYWAENVRTGAVGKATPQQKSIADVVREALEVGREEVRPGKQAFNVYEKVHSVLRKAKVDNALIISRSGHGVGLEYHEPPFIELGDKTVFEPGMAVTVEPGIFVSGYGGFTLSDTLVVTERGCEVLTSYPIDLHEA
jgi:Xaa-Pro aminopeptidase